MNDSDKVFYGQDGKGKLVRDKIPVRLREKEVKFEVREAMASEMMPMLLLKLQEELAELDQEEFLSDKWAEELADLREVLITIEFRTSKAGYFIPICDRKGKAFSPSEPIELLEPRLHSLVKELAELTLHADRWRWVLADLTLVSLELCNFVKGEDVGRRMERKRKKSGAFNKGVVLLWTCENSK